MNDFILNVKQQLDNLEFTHNGEHIKTRISFRYAIEKMDKIQKEQLMRL